jgi:carbonic anhydrase/acetyltransferase-like protein (isoleucine patch superfamily)
MISAELSGDLHPRSAFREYVQPGCIIVSMFIEFRGKSPKIAASAFIAPTAVLIGDVEVGEHSSIWFGVVIRADNGPIRIGARSNVQDNSVVHVGHGGRTIVGDDCTVGHCVTMEDCVIENGALIGSNAVVLNGATVGSRALVAAGSVVPNNARVPSETLSAGVPAVYKRQLDAEGLAHVERTPLKYVNQAKAYLEAGIGHART